MRYFLLWEKIKENGLLSKYKWVILLLSILLFISTYSILWFNSMLKPVDISNKNYIRYEVKNGSSARQVANEMKEKGLIKNALVFNWYSKYKKYDIKLKSGIYLLSPSMSSEEILKKIAEGKSEIQDKKVTIPEGVRLEQIAQILEENGIVTADTFLKEASVGKFQHKYEFLKEIPAEKSLEGFLFPDTYYLQPGKAPETYIDIFLKRFVQIYFEKNNLHERQKLIGMSTYDVVTLASIIEWEAKLDKERPIVSGVFHNRLNIGMPLQSCATVEYALNEHKEVLTLDDLEVDSPYNTYKHLGLPPGPIGSPGLSSLKAAVNPADVDFLYFVAKGDGTHLFAKTLEEHNINKNIVRK